MNESENKVYKPNEFAKLLKVTTRTLRNWDGSGKLKSYRNAAGRRYYTYDQYLQLINEEKVFVKSPLTETLGAPSTPTTPTPRQFQNAFYARAYGPGTEDDLEEQVCEIEKFCSEQGVSPDLFVKDYDGFSYDNRTDWYNLINNIMDRRIATLFLTNKVIFLDGEYILFEQMCKHSGTVLTEIDQTIPSPDEPERDLFEETEEIEEASEEEPEGESILPGSDTEYIEALRERLIRFSDGQTNYCFTNNSLYAAYLGVKFEDTLLKKEDLAGNLSSEIKPADLAYTVNNCILVWLMRMIHRDMQQLKEFGDTVTEMYHVAELKEDGIKRLASDEESKAIDKLFEEAGMWTDSQISIDDFVKKKDTKLKEVFDIHLEKQLYYVTFDTSNRRFSGRSDSELLEIIRRSTNMFVSKECGKRHENQPFKKMMDYNVSVTRWIDSVLKSPITELKDSMPYAV